MSETASTPQSALRTRLEEDVKAAMRAKDKQRLGALRLVMAAIKQREVDDRRVLSDGDVIAVLEKMVKQRRDSIRQYEAAGRQELADQEHFEVELIKGYMPTALTEDALAALVDAAIAETAASTPKDMGKVMAVLKPQIQGRCDMGQVSALVKQRLGA